MRRDTHLAPAPLRGLSSIRREGHLPSNLEEEMGS